MSKTGRPPLPKNPAVAEYIQKIRKEWGLSYSGMASRLGISRTSAADYEAGRSAPPVEKCRDRAWIAKLNDDKPLAFFWYRLVDLRSNAPVLKQCDIATGVVDEAIL